MILTFFCKYTLRISKFKGKSYKNYYVQACDNILLNLFYPPHPEKHLILGGRKEKYITVFFAGNYILLFNLSAKN